MSIYAKKPDRFLTPIHEKSANPETRLYCAGFELTKWRCDQFAFHLAEWLPDYALPEEELAVDHGNILVKMNQAAVRVYTSDKYKSRGEAGEIALHAICRDFFNTVPISPRVFYKSASNDVVKAFDMVHVRFPDNNTTQIWLGESKLFKSGSTAIKRAIASIKTHVDDGFLSNQKMILGPQIPKSTPRYDDVMAIFKKSETLDTLIKNAVFVVGILCNGQSVANATCHDPTYKSAAIKELEALEASLSASGLQANLKLLLVYIPLLSKDSFVSAFDKRLKGLQ